MTDRVEGALRRHRTLTIGALVVLALLAWAWLFAGAGMGMSPIFSFRVPAAVEDSVSMETLNAAIAWSPTRFMITFSMWWIMMVAMMLPSAAPMILLYSRAATHKRADLRPATESFLAGYLLAWGVFSLIATGLQLALERIGVLSPMFMAFGSLWLSGGFLIAAGIYQLSPFKNVCLRHCRNPAQFLSRHYSPGHLGALRMGLTHGTYCTGCCWLLMLLLFVGGVMNLAWIALLTVMVAGEKLLPNGRLVALVLGIGCLVWGSAIIVG